MKPIPFSYRLLMVTLVTMVIIDCVCGDTLSSLIKRRKKIKKKIITTTTTTTELPVVETKEEESVQKEELTPQIPVIRGEIIGKGDDPKEDVVIDPEIKYISLLDANSGEVKEAASEIVEKKENEAASKISEKKENQAASKISEKNDKEAASKIIQKIKKEEKEAVSEIIKKIKEEAASEIVEKKEKVATVTIVEKKVEPLPIVEEVNKERIVKEWMAFRSGVPVDYSYNETAINSGDIVSVPGCPKSIDGYPWVLHYGPSSSEAKCYLVGHHATVCQGSAVMNYQRDSDFGICACNFQECLLKRGLPLHPTSDLSAGNLLRRRNGSPGKLRFRFCRPMGVTCEEFVYDQKEKRCDILYTQGPCKRKQWLQRNSKGGVECGKRLCDVGSGLTEKSEQFQRANGNVTEENAECCRPWGGFAVNMISKLSNSLTCESGQIYSETLGKCLPFFKMSSLIVG